MKQPKYILIIVVLGIIAFVGWNKIDIFTKDKESQEVTLICGPPEEEDFMIVNVSNGKMCFIDPTGQTQPICAEVEVNNSKTIIRSFFFRDSWGTRGKFVSKSGCPPKRFWSVCFEIYYCYCVNPGNWKCQSSGGGKYS